MEVTQTIREFDWRQGSIFSASLAERALESSEPRIDPRILERRWRLIVIGQDCDVVNPKLEVEPWVEILAMLEGEREDSSLFHLRNPRRLQFYGDASGRKVLLEANIHDRSRIPRELLASEPPTSDIVLPPGQILCLVRWLARRYDRQALPDEFNRRLRPCHRKIKSALAKAPLAVSQLLLALEPWGEQPEGAAYRVSIVGTMSEVDYDNIEKVRAAEEALSKLEEALNGVKGVELEDNIELRSEARVSLSDLRRYTIWDFETISLNAEET